MYTCIIFDIDGTILDNETAVLSSLQKLVLEELHQNLRLEDLRFALGIPGEAALTKLGLPDLLASNAKWNCAFGAGIDFGLAAWGAKSSTGINPTCILENPGQILELIKV